MTGWHRAGARQPFTQEAGLGRGGALQRARKYGAAQCGAGRSGQGGRECGVRALDRRSRGRRASLPAHRGDVRCLAKSGGAIRFPGDASRSCVLPLAGKRHDRSGRRAPSCWSVVGGGRPLGAAAALHCAAHAHRGCMSCRDAVPAFSMPAPSIRTSRSSSLPQRVFCRHETRAPSCAAASALAALCQPFPPVSCARCCRAPPPSRKPRA